MQLLHCLAAAIVLLISLFVCLFVCYRLEQGGCQHYPDVVKTFLTDRRHLLHHAC